VAFLQKGPDGDDFINIDQSVGRGKINSPNDVLVVQALLAIVFNFFTKLKVLRPGSRVVKVSNRLQPDTPKLIAIYQKEKLKRPIPQGFCNQAPSSSSPQIKFNTLVNLWNDASFAQAFSGGAASGEGLLARLQREHPTLRNLRQQLSEVVIRADEVDRHPAHLEDQNLPERRLRTAVP
jgi:hypothetical protein